MCRSMLGCFVAFLLLTGVATASEDWIVDGRFRLCLRENGKSPDSGNAFLFRDDETVLGCLRGTFSRNKSKKILTLKFPEAWYGTRESDRVWWSLVQSASRQGDAPLVEFEYMDDRAGKLILTHNPRGSFWFSGRDDYFKRFEIERGEIFEFDSAKKKIGLLDRQMPPGLCETAQYLNRLKSKPSSIWGLGTLVNQELMMYVTDSTRNLVGLSAMTLTPSSDNKFSGEVWIVNHTFDGQLFRAGKGTYSLTQASGDAQAYDLSLSFPKTYKYEGGKGVTAWKADLMNETGFTVRIPMTDRGFSVLNHGYVCEMFYIDPNGRRQRRYYDQGFLQELLHGKSEMNAYLCLGFSAVHSFEMQILRKLADVDSREAARFQQLLIESCPPGYGQSAITRVVSSVAQAKSALERGDMATAGKFYELHLEKHPDDEEVLFEYARAVRDSNRSRSIALYRKLVAIQPDKAVYHLNLGAVLEETDNEGALKEYEIGLKKAKDKSHRAFAKKRMAAVFDSQGKFKEAFDSYSRAYFYNASDLNTGNAMTWLYAEHGDESWPNGKCDQFVKQMERKEAIKAAGESYWLYIDTIAAYKASRGHFDEAIELQTKAVDAIAKKSTDPNLLVEIKNRLYFYQNGITFKASKEFQYWHLKYADVKHFAKLTGVERSLVKLKLANGEEKSIPIDLFTPEDQAKIQKAHRVARPVIR
jgi:tetratricopeptide (TPR) repeat protein